MPDAGHNGETESDRPSANTAADAATRAAPSLAILGSDALLAARPATAVQLAHACLRIGFQAVVPASWGDELIAGGCLKQLGSRRRTSEGSGGGPAIFCACPYVAHRLLAVGPDLEPFLASFVAPPVAVARYLRALYEPMRLRLTYVGRCPGAADDTIDARVTPDELLAVLAERGVDLLEQPRAFDSVIPPDRRRFLSQPGGLPASDVLRRVDPSWRVVEVTAGELVPELAQLLLSTADVLVDVAPRLGCACSGAVAGTAVDGARAEVTALEPPRAGSPVVDDRVPATIELPLPPAARGMVDLIPSVAGRRTSGASRAVRQPEESSPSAGENGTPGERRRSPPQGVVRQPSGSVPTTRSGEGRALPRAYVARRGTAGRGRGPSTPPRGEPPQKIDASGQTPERDSGRGTERGSLRGSQRGSSAPAPARELPEWVERPLRGEHERREAERRQSAAPAPVAAPSTGAAVASPAGEAATMEPVLALGGPDHAVEPQTLPIPSAGEMATTESTAREPAVSTAAASDLWPAPPAEPRAPSPIPKPSASAEPSLGARTAAFARTAIGTAHQRRATVAALLAVALLSASVGVLAGRWLAARTAAPAAGETR